MDRQLEVAYLAGVLDSDGWFTIHCNTKQSANPTYSPSMGISQLTPEACALAYKLWGGKLGEIDYSKQNNRFSKRPLCTWAPHKEGLELLLGEVIPFLRIKKEQAKILLRLRLDIKFHGRTGGREKKSLSPQTVEFRSKLYQQFLALRNASVATTECGDSSSSSDEEKRQSGLYGNVQSSTEMMEPTV